MSRRLSALALSAVAASACSPVFDVELGWTIDGEDPAGSCEFLPEGSVVRVTATSRDRHDERFAGEVKETVTEHDCARGSGPVQVGNFSDVLVELVHPKDGGDDVYGTAPPFELNPGAASSGYAVDDEVPVADIRLTQGTLHANLTVVGRNCGDAGASSFTVALYENSEPRTNTLVEEGIEVACEGNAAEFAYSPVRVDARYVVVATTTIGGVTYATDGEGVDIRSANTFSTIDLQAD